MADHAVKADARDRALRTLWTGLGTDVAVGTGTALALWVGNADIGSAAAWGALGILVARSALQAVASYLVRLKVSPAEAGGEEAPA